MSVSSPRPMAALRPVTNVEDARILQERAARAARIDKLGVDRSRLAGLSVPVSEEMQRGEEGPSRIRQARTESDRIAAWRTMFKNGRR